MSTEFWWQALQCFFRPPYPSSDSRYWSHNTTWSFISIPISMKVGCNQDSARDLLKRQQTSSNTSLSGNSIQQKQRQDSCSSTKMWVSDQGTWCYFLNILHPNSFQPWKQKKPGQTYVKLFFQLKVLFKVILHIHLVMSTNLGEVPPPFFLEVSHVGGIPNVVFIKDSEFGMKFTRRNSPVRIFWQAMGLPIVLAFMCSSQRMSIALR